jgi:hypothetical protein
MSAASNWQWRTVAALSALTLALSCGSSSNNKSDGGAGGHGGSAGAAAGGSGGGGSGGKGAGGGSGGSAMDASADGRGAGGAGGAAGTGGAGGAAACSSAPPVACTGGLICDPDTPNRCAAGSEPGHCIVLPTGCPSTVMPVCGCNGTTYDNDCARQMARAQLNHTGACP